MRERKKISAKNKNGKEIIEISQTVWICQRENIIKVLNSWKGQWAESTQKWSCRLIQIYRLKRKLREWNYQSFDGLLIAGAWSRRLIRIFSNSATSLFTLCWRLLLLMRSRSATWSLFCWRFVTKMTAVHQPTTKLSSSLLFYIRMFDKKQFIIRFM